MRLARIAHYLSQRLLPHSRSSRFEGPVLRTLCAPAWPSHPLHALDAGSILSVRGSSPPLTTNPCVICAPGNLLRTRFPLPSKMENIQNSWKSQFGDCLGTPMTLITVRRFPNAPSFLLIRNELGNSSSLLEGDYRNLARPELFHVLRARISTPSCSKSGILVSDRLGQPI